MSDSLQGEENSNSWLLESSVEVKNCTDRKTVTKQFQSQNRVPHVGPAAR